MELFEKNLAVLKAKNPSLASTIERLPEEAAPPITYAKSGDPVPYVKGIYLHSSYNPLSEAKKFIDTYELAGCRTVLVLGLGLAYHVKELIRRTDVPIVVIERAPEMLSAALKTVPLDDVLSRVELIVAEPPEAVAKSKAVQEALSGRYALVAHPPSLRSSADYYNALVKEFEKAQPRRNQGRLRVLVVSPLYGGSMTIAKYAARALERIGCKVDFVDNSRFYPPYKTLESGLKNKKNKDWLTKYYTHFLSLYAYAKVKEFEPDLVFALAQAPLDEDCLKTLASEKVKTAFWFVENYRVLTYWRSLAWQYNYFFTIQRGEFYKKLSELGALNYSYLPLACDPSMHRPMDLSNEESATYGGDLSFAGMGYYNRQLTFQGLLDFKDLKIWGTGWDPNVFGAVLQNRGAEFDEETMVKIYNASKINLNLHSSTYSAGVEPGGDFVNPRTFELAGCGAFQLLDKRTELGELFSIGEEVVCFNDLHDLREKIRYYLDHPAERAQIAEKARARALRDHTYDLRMKQMLKLVFSESVVEDLENQTDIDLAGNLLKEVRQGHDLYPILAGYPSDTKLTLDRLINDQYKAGKYQSNPELILCLMQDILAAGKKR